MDKLTIIKEWEKKIKEINKNLDNLNNSIGFDCESPLILSIYELINSYTKCVSILIGDELGFFEWYLYERPEKDAKVSIGDDEYIVNNVKDLLKVISETSKQKGELT